MRVNYDNLRSLCEQLSALYADEAQYDLDYAPQVAESYARDAGMYTDQVAALSAASAAMEAADAIPTDKLNVHIKNDLDKAWDQIKVDYAEWQEWEKSQKRLFGQEQHVRTHYRNY
jgi:hypothetical protein